MTNNNMNKAALAGIKFAFGFIKILLAVTTAIAGYSLGKGFAGSLSIGVQEITGIAFSIICVLAIDGGLDRFFKALLAKDRPDPYFWIGAIVLTVGTGTFTWFSAAIIGDMENSYISVDHHAEQVEDARAQKKSDLSMMTETVRSKKNEIAKLNHQMSQDTARILSTFRENHYKLYKSGQYKKYYGKSRYATLSASIDRLNAAMRPYKSKIQRLNIEIAKLEGKHTDLLSTNVAATVSQSVIDHNNRIARKEANKAGLVKFIDIAGVVFMWILFWGIRKMHLKEKVYDDVEGKDFLKWAMDYITVLQKKALETDTKLDDAFVAALAAIVSLFNSVFKLFAWALECVSKLIELPTKIGTGSVTVTQNNASVTTSPPSVTKSARTVTQPLRSATVTPPQTITKPVTQNSYAMNTKGPQQQLPTAVTGVTGSNVTPTHGSAALKSEPVTKNEAVTVELTPTVTGKKPQREKKSVTVTQPQVYMIAATKAVIEGKDGDRETVTLQQVGNRKRAHKGKMKTGKKAETRKNAKQWFEFYQELENKMKAAK